VERNDKNKIELEGNVARIGDVFTNKNGKKSIHFDLAQNSQDGKYKTSQFIPVVLRGNLFETYGQEIEKGDWLNVKGRLTSYIGKNNDKKYEVTAFEVKNLENDKEYTMSENELDSEKDEVEKDETEKEQER